MSKICAFHGGCVDGQTAAWLVARTFGTDDDPMLLVPCAYGDDPPAMSRGDEVWIVDFSFPPAIVSDLCIAVERMDTEDYGDNGMIHLWDHHKTAADQYDGIGSNPVLDIEIDMNRSGAGIAWDRCANLLTLVQDGPDVELIVASVQDHDLWRHDIPWSAEVTDALRAMDFSLEAWDYAMATDYETLAQEGRAIGRFKHQTINQALRGVRCALIGDHWVPAVNVNYSLGSDAAAKLLDVYDAPFAAYYYDGADGIRHWGLRSKPDGADVARIAETYGGGGHVHAAGARGSDEMIEFWNVTRHGPAPLVKR